MSHEHEHEFDPKPDSSTPRPDHEESSRGIVPRNPNLKKRPNKPIGVDQARLDRAELLISGSQFLACLCFSKPEI
ncbi:hypothetical protein PNOK_0132800 [Pyrrhoderma noxium]|uniref:Uncharacterized protein n=1 Tax=Pyrrhoderma noxium TaxID=2282107 RepID=A0A286UXD5_9AGAM|nr:hypothetical protein PNOK_0132800 [Pyrrhoderma noxium]